MVNKLTGTTCDARLYYLSSSGIRGARARVKYLLGPLSHMPV